MQESQCKSLQQSKHHLWPQRAHMWEEKATSEGVTMQCGRCFDGVEGVMQTPRDAASSSLPLPYLCRFPSRVSRLLPKHVSLSCQPLFCLQFSSAAQSCPTLHDPMNRSMPGLPVHHQLPESTQTHVDCIGDAIQPSYPLSSPSPALNLSQHQGLFKWVSSLHQVGKALEFQLQHLSFQWTPRTDLL